jgi:hypothetical protein
MTGEVDSYRLDPELARYLGWQWCPGIHIHTGLVD